MIEMKEKDKYKYGMYVQVNDKEENGVKRERRERGFMSYSLRKCLYRDILFEGCYPTDIKQSPNQLIPMPWLGNSKC